MTTTMSSSIHEILQCNICQEMMRDPKMLRCQHSFCCRCLHKWWKSQRKEADFIHNLSCPTCRAVTTLPPGDVKELKTDLTQKKLADILREPQNPLCEVCLESGAQPQRKAEYFCKDCNSHMCKTCADAHKKFRLFRKHCLLSAVDKELCEQHPLKSKDFYCENCDLLLCSLCVTNDVHQGHQDLLHDAKEYSEVNAESLKELETQLAKINQLPNHLKDVCKDQLPGLKKIDEHITSLKDGVLQLADTAMKTIQLKKQEIHSSLEKAREAVKKRQAWAEGAEMIKPQAEQLVQKYHTYLDTRNPTDLLVDFKDLNKKVKHGISKYSKNIPSLGPDELPLEYLPSAGFLATCQEDFAVGIYSKSVNVGNHDNCDYNTEMLWY